MKEAISSEPQPKGLDDSERRQLGHVVSALLQQWQLPATQQLALLGLSPGSRSLLTKYRKGTAALPPTQDVADRVSYLLSIHKGLRLLYPFDEQLRFGWIHMANRVLDGRTPLSVMLEGLVGLARIARFVDFERGR